MLFCLVLLVLSGVFSISEEFLFKSDKRLTDIRTQVAEIDIFLQTKLNVEHGSLACLPEPVKELLEPAIYGMCRSLKTIAEIAGASPSPKCKTHSEQPPPGQLPAPPPC
jgi:hypothetical protein